MYSTPRDRKISTAHVLRRACQYMHGPAWRWATRLIPPDRDVSLYNASTCWRRAAAKPVEMRFNSSNKSTSRHRRRQRRWRRSGPEWNERWLIIAGAVVMPRFNYQITTELDPARPGLDRAGGLGARPPSWSSSVKRGRNPRRHGQHIDVRTIRATPDILL